MIEQVLGCTGMTCFAQGPEQGSVPPKDRAAVPAAQPSEPNTADLKAGRDLSMVDTDAVKSPWAASVEGSKHRLVRVWSKA